MYVCVSSQRYNSVSRRMENRLRRIQQLHSERGRRRGLPKSYRFTLTFSFSLATYRVTDGQFLGSGLPRQGNAQVHQVHQSVGRCQRLRGVSRFIHHVLRIESRLFCLSRVETLAIAERSARAQFDWLRRRMRRRTLARRPANGTPI